MIVIQAIKPEKSENLHLTEKENISTNTAIRQHNRWNKTKVPPCSFIALAQISVVMLSQTCSLYQRLVKSSRKRQV